MTPKQIENAKKLMGLSDAELEEFVRKNNKGKPETEIQRILTERKKLVSIYKSKKPGLKLSMDSVGAGGGAGGSEGTGSGSEGTGSGSEGTGSGSDPEDGNLKKRPKAKDKK